MNSSDEGETSAGVSRGGRFNRLVTSSDKSVTKKRLGRILYMFYRERDHWKKYGGLRVCCGETHIIAPVKTWWWMSEVFLILTTALLAYKLFAYSRAVLVPAFVIALIELAAFYKTCLRDPGIQPRSDFVTAFKTLLDVISNHESDVGLGVMRMHVNANGVSEKQTYCWRCHHYRPLHTTHCGTCDCCMMKHDHHCPVFGGCVAKKNLAAFHIMVGTQISFWLYVLGYCIYKISTTEDFQVRLAPDELTRDRLLTPKLVFYVVIAEIAAVAILPPIIQGTIALFCKKKARPEYQVQVVGKDQIEELLHFARANNFTIDELNQIKKLYQNSSELTPGVHKKISRNSDENENDSAETV